jgi:8-amino-7-oxononanoate synthase
MPFAALQSGLDRRISTGLLRERHTVESPQSPRIVLEGKSYMSFCSNDYLGFANHPRLIAALQQGAAQYGVGAGAAHLVTGHMQPHDLLERRLGEFVGKPAALFFSTGYMANLGCVQALVGKADTVFADKLNHASLNDAMLMSRAKIRRYRHNDMNHLSSLLGSGGHGKKLVITDAVFSMDGDIAPLPELLEVCEEHNAWILVDDAHGFGVLGEGGRGSLSHFRTESPRVIYMATLGKAAGVFGAFVAAERTVIDTLVNNARSYVYTTASPPALASALLESLRLIEEGDFLRENLQGLIAQLRRGLAGMRWPLMPSATAIQPLLIGDTVRAAELGMALQDRGIWVPAIRPPTVPEGTARLRITLSAAHTDRDVDQLIEVMHELAR